MGRGNVRGTGYMNTMGRLRGESDRMTRRGFLGFGTAGAAGMAAGGCASPPTRADYPPLGRFVTVDGLRVHAVETGEGPPVVLIHGASGNLRDFTFGVTDRIAAAGFRAIAMDRPGFGYSDRPAADGAVPAVQAAILRRAASALGAERPIVVGHSYGGAVAMAWAVDAPEQTAGVVSLAGATYPWGGDAGLIYRLGAHDVTAGLTRGLARLLIDVSDPEAVIARVFKPNEPPPGYAEYVGVGLALRPDTFQANARDLNALNGILERQAPRYRGLSVPVEAIHGDADRTVWAEVHSVPLVRHVAQGRLTMLPGIGHMPHHVDTAALIAALQRLAA
jgi:pimeloyl-ACP methyl ester carboxylesterase